MTLVALDANGKKTDAYLEIGGVPARCPFIDPKFELDPDTPCPVCGGLGHIDSEIDCKGG